MSCRWVAVSIRRVHDAPMPLKNPEKPSSRIVLAAQSAIDLYLSEACKRTLIVSRGWPICVVVREGVWGEGGENSWMPAARSWWLLVALRVWRG